jgi:hypothetical protein
MDWIHLIQDGNESSSSIKCWESLEWLIDWRLLKKDQHHAVN